MKKRATKTVTFRTTPDQHAHLPELCRLHGGVPISRVIRRLIDQELVRLRLTEAPSEPKLRYARRHAV